MEVKQPPKCEWCNGPKASKRQKTCSWECKMALGIASTAPPKEERKPWWTAETMAELEPQYT